MSASPPNPPSARPSLQEMEDLRFWMDHPELDLACTGLDDVECRILKQDAETCQRLLFNAGRNPSRIVGAGTYGIVFETHEEALNRVVAIKVLRPSVMVSPQSKIRFAFEAKALARCEIPGVVRLYEYGEINGVPFLVTQFVDGPVLSQKIPMFGDSDGVKVACRLIIEVCKSMQSMHDLGFIHRDLKPSNILLKPTGHSTDDAGATSLFFPVITDFGFAKESGSIADNSRSGTAIVGTVQYMSPEQAQGESKRVSVKSDVYSIGVILYELLTQKCPFSAETKRELIWKIVRDEPVPPRECAPYLSRDLEAILLKSLAKKPEDRYASVAALADDLDNYLRGRQTTARPVGQFRKLIFAAKRNLLITGLWCAVSSLAAITALGLWRERTLNQQLVIKNNASEESMKQATIGYKKFYQRLAEEKWDTPRKMTERLELHKQALEFFRWKAAATKNDLDSRHDLSTALHFVSSSHGTLGQIPESIQARKECLQLLEVLVHEYPDNEEYRFDLFMSLMLLGHLEHAHENWQAALAEIDSLCRAHPTNFDYLDARNALWLSIVHLLINSNRELERAKSIVEEVLSTSYWLAEQKPDTPNYGKYVPQCYGMLGRLALLSDDKSELVRFFELAIKAQREHSAKFDHKGPWLADEHHLRMQYITALKSAELYAEVIPQCQAQIELIGELMEWYPEDTGYIMTRSHVELTLSIALRKLGIHDEANEYLETARKSRAAVEFPVRNALDLYEKLLNEAAEATVLPLIEKRIPRR